MRHTKPTGLEFFRLDPVLDGVVGDEVPDELLVCFVQLAAPPLGRTKQLAVVQRVVGNGKPVHRAFLHPRQRWDRYLCTYDLYGPVHNVFDACRYRTLRGQVGGGLGPGNRELLGPVKWHRADRRVQFWAQKTLSHCSPQPPIQNILEINKKL
jgi:hypothetical protein